MKYVFKYLANLFLFKFNKNNVKNRIMEKVCHGSQLLVSELKKLEAYGIDISKVNGDDPQAIYYIKTEPKISVRLRYQSSSDDNFVNVEEFIEYCKDVASYTLSGNLDPNQIVCIGCDDLQKQLQKLKDRNIIGEFSGGANDASASNGYGIRIDLNRRVQYADISFYRGQKFPFVSVKEFIRIWEKQSAIPNFDKICKFACVGCSELYELIKELISKHFVSDDSSALRASKNPNCCIRLSGIKNINYAEKSWYQNNGYNIVPFDKFRELVKECFPDSIKIDSLTTPSSVTPSSAKIDKTAPRLIVCEGSLELHKVLGILIRLGICHENSIFTDGSTKNPGRYYRIDSLGCICHGSYETYQGMKCKFVSPRQFLDEWLNFADVDLTQYYNALQDNPSESINPKKFSFKKNKPKVKIVL